MAQGAFIGQDAIIFLGQPHERGLTNWESTFYKCCRNIFFESYAFDVWSFCGLFVYRLSLTMNKLRSKKASQGEKTKTDEKA